MKDNNIDENLLNNEARVQWNRKAEFWDKLHGDEGNKFHRELVSPAVEKLLKLQKGETVLDVACGNGVMSRRLAFLGGIVTAVDFSNELIQLAKSRGDNRIDYQEVDAIDEKALTALGKFDAIVCTMALMDMPTITPLFRAIAQMLNQAGRFIFATAHPSFNSTNPSFLAEMVDKDGEINIQHTLKIEAYLDIPPIKAVGAIGEPSAHYFYHRPLQELLEEGFSVGLVLDGLMEPAFPARYSDLNQLKFWVNTPQIPPVLAGRFKLKQDGSSIQVDPETKTN